jgi:4-deoxy-L-threo-5-hexosulose-uronate ketol-isomerase
MISPTPRELESMGTDAVRKSFLIENVMNDRQASLSFTDLDRLALGGVKPAGGPITLENDPETGSEFFLARRELGILNTGSRGVVRVDGKSFEMANCDCLYVGMGSKSISFESMSASDPAKFFLMSCPAHQTFPTTMARKSEANPVKLGSQATANQRTIYQYIHQKGIKSAQLVMGYTELAEGSVWNTMPPHTHSRRTEIYYYFDLQPNQIVSHFLGSPDATRHVFVHSEQAVLSPAWSIHCGCGTAAYKFIWAMGGENQTFDDMDKVAPLDLR